MSTTKADATSATAEQASVSSAAPAAAAPIGLVQQLGNQGLQALLRARLMQAKLTVSHPQDSFEQEADRVAEQVMRTPSSLASQPVGGIQRLPEGERDVRRFSTASDVPSVDAATEQSIRSLSGRGSTLPDSVRSFMEPRFGADFSTVRVHTDAHAHRLARSVNAQAFTVGRHVVFGAGHYAPDTETGKRLLAHELTHTIQQGSASRVVQRSPEAGRVSAIPRPTLLTAARGSDDSFKDPFKPVRTIDDWASGSIDVSTLQPSELQAAIDELQQWLDRQNTSSFKGVRIETTLAALRDELRKRYLATKKPVQPRDSRGKKKKPAEPPEISPRVLTEKNVSIGYANAGEARAEFDLIMQWLTVPGLERDKRLLLLKERANLESLLGLERKREASERYVTRVRAALTSSDKNPVDALKSVVGTIESISKDPENEEISYIYHQGERLAISTQQATQLRNDMVRTLGRAAFEIWEGVAQQSLRDRARQIKINEESRFTSRVSEIFTGHLLSYADDPYEKMLHLNGDVFDDYRTLREHLKAGHLTDAASLLPHMEKQAREMEDLAKEFTGTYLRGAERAVATFKITAQLAVSIELAILTAGTASFVSGLVEGAGLTGIGAGTATVLGTGTLVAGETAAVRGGIAFGDAMLTGQSLGDAWQATKGAAVEGLKEGFFAGATAGGGRVLASAFGVGKNVAYQAARRAGAEAVANGTSAIVKAIVEKKSADEVLEAGWRSAIAAVPGAWVGSGSTKRLIMGSLAAYGTAFADAYSRPEASMEDALAAASIAMATHLASSKLGHETDAGLAKRGQRVGKAVKNTAINTTVAVAIRAATLRPPPSYEASRVGVHDTAERTRVASPVGDEAQPDEPSKRSRHISSENSDAEPNASRSRPNESDDSTKEELGDGDGERAMFGWWRRRRRNTPVLPPPKGAWTAPSIHEGPVAPARLYELFQRGPDLAVSHAPLRGSGEPAQASGEYRSGMASPHEAYAAFNEALSVSEGREVGIFWNRWTGEYRVVVGTLGTVGPSTGGKWLAIVHFHPNPSHALTLRWPSPLDFEGLNRRSNVEGGVALEFVAHDLPSENGRGRGFVEYGYDPSSRRPYYMQVREADGTTWKRSFGDLNEYRKFWAERGILFEKGSPDHADALEGVRDLFDARRENAVAWVDQVLNVKLSFSTLVDFGLSVGPKARGKFGAARPLGKIPSVEVADVQSAFDAALRGGAEAVHPPTAAAGGLTIAVIRVPASALPEGNVTIGLSGRRSTEVPEYEDYVIEPSRSVRASSESPRGPGPKVRPYELRPRELQLLTEAKLGQPVPNLKGKVHPYRNQDDYELRYRSDSGESGPAPTSYIVNETGEIHLSPAATIDAAVHEVIHLIAIGREPLGRRFIGAFLDEGVTDALARAGSNASLDQSAYQKHMAFYRLLRRILGPGVIEAAVLNGEYGRLRARVLAVFGGDDVRTREFFYKLQGIGEDVQNRIALDQAVAMLEEATGRPALQWSRTGPQPSSTPNSPHARIERVGPFSFLGTKTVRQESGATIIDRRISATVRSGVPIAEPDTPLLLRQLVEDAKASGGTRLRVAVEFVDSPSEIFLRSLANVFHGALTKSGSVYVLDLDVGAQTPPSSSGSEGVASGSGASPKVRKSVGGRDDDGRASGKTARAANGASIQELIDDAATMARALDEGHPVRGDLKNFIAEANTADRWVSKGIRAGGDRATQAEGEVQRLANDLAEIKRIYPDDLLQAIAHGEGPTRVDAIPLGGTAEVRPGLSIRSSGTEAEISGGSIPHREAAPDRALPADQPSVVLGDGLEAEAAPPARNDFSDNIPTRDIKPSSERHFLENIVAQARARLSNVLGKLDARQGVAPGEEHLSPECMSGHCGLSRRTVARALKEAGIPDERIFMNDSSKIAGTGAHTFIVVEIAPGRYILIDATFAQFTGMLDDAPRVGETILRRSGQVGAQVRSELLEKGYLVLNDEIADAYMKVVGESERGAYKVQDLVRDQARLDRNPELLVGL